MQSVIEKFESTYRKNQVPNVRSGDTVRVHQRIVEGSKERVQVFEGVVIRTKRANIHTASITVRRLASGVGVEKSFLIHSPNIEKIEIMRSSKVRRNYLTFLRQRQGKSARLQEVTIKEREPQDKNQSEAKTAVKEPKDSSVQSVKDTPKKPLKK